MTREDVRLPNIRYYELLEEAYDKLDAFEPLGSWPVGYADFENTFQKYGVTRGVYDETKDYHAVAKALMHNLYEGEKAADNAEFTTTSRDFENVRGFLSKINTEESAIWMQTPEYKAEKEERERDYQEWLKSPEYAEEMRKREEFQRKLGNI